LVLAKDKVTHCILIALASRSLHHFAPHLIFTYRTLQFICSAFSRHSQIGKHAF